jgi:hypothetical protein
MCIVLYYSLEQEASKCAASGNTERHRELTEKLKQQHEILEAERKVCHIIRCSYYVPILFTLNRPWMPIGL